jgi:hypothetical protein
MTSGGKIHICDSFGGRDLNYITAYISYLLLSLIYCFPDRSHNHRVPGSNSLLPPSRLPAHIATVLYNSLYTPVPSALLAQDGQGAPARVQLPFLGHGFKLLCILSIKLF